MAALLALYASSIAAPTQPVLTTTVSTPVVLAAQQTELMEFDVRPPSAASCPCPAASAGRRPQEGTGHAVPVGSLM